MLRSFSVPVLGEVQAEQTIKLSRALQVGGADDDEINLHVCQLT